MATLEQCVTAYLQYRQRVPCPPKRQKIGRPLRVWTPAKDYMMRTLAGTGWNSVKISKVVELSPKQVRQYAGNNKIRTGNKKALRSGNSSKGTKKKHIDIVTDRKGNCNG